MSNVKKIHVLLKNVINMHVISTELVSTGKSLVYVNSKLNGCVLKYRKAYNLDDINSDIVKALLTICKEREDDITEEFNKSEKKFNVDFIDKEYVDKNFSICFDTSSKHIFIDFEN